MFALRYMYMLDQRKTWKFIPAIRYHEINVYVHVHIIKTENWITITTYKTSHLNSNTRQRHLPPTHSLMLLSEPELSRGESVSRRVSRRPLPESRLTLYWSAFSRAHSWCRNTSTHFSLQRRDINARANWSLRNCQGFMKKVRSEMHHKRCHTGMQLSTCYHDC